MSQRQLTQVAVLLARRPDSDEPFWADTGNGYGWCHAITTYFESKKTTIRNVYINWIRQNDTPTHCSFGDEWYFR